MHSLRSRTPYAVDGVGLAMAWYAGESAYGVRIDPPLRYVGSLRRRVGRVLRMSVRVDYATMAYVCVGGDSTTANGSVGRAR